MISASCFFFFFSVPHVVQVSCLQTEKKKSEHVKLQCLFKRPAEFQPCGGKEEVSLIPLLAD